MVKWQDVLTEAVNDGYHKSFSGLMEFLNWVSEETFRRDKAEWEAEEKKSREGLRLKGMISE